MQTDSLLWLHSLYTTKQLLTGEGSNLKKIMLWKWRKSTQFLYMNFQHFLLAPTVQISIQSCLGLSFSLACPRGQLWNPEPSLEFGQWIFVKFEGAYSGIFRDRVFVSCISLYVLHCIYFSDGTIMQRACSTKNANFSIAWYGSPLHLFLLGSPLLWYCTSLFTCHFWKMHFCCKTDVNKYSTAHMAWRVCKQKISIPDYWLLRTGMFPNLFITSLYRSSFLPPLDISEIYLPPIIKINTSAFPPQCPNSN